MSLQTKSLVYQFLAFAILFIAARFLIGAFTGLSGFWIPVTAAVVATLVCPQFKAIRTPQGEKIYMKWIFFKGVKEIK